MYLKQKCKYTQLLRNMSIEISHSRIYCRYIFIKILNIPMQLNFSEQLDTRISFSEPTTDWQKQLLSVFNENTSLGNASAGEFLNIYD